MADPADSRTDISFYLLPGLRIFCPMFSETRIMHGP